MPSEALISEETRLLGLTTPPGQDVLLVNRVSVKETLSRLFSMDLDLMAEQANAAAVVSNDLLMKPMGIRILRDSGEPKCFHGIVSRFSEIGANDDYVYYRAEVVPWFWLLTLSAGCRIFQNKTVPDIIEQVFGELGFTDFRSSLSRTYTKWDYCVQYRETTFNFLCRLMEQEGIFYYFEHHRDKHVLVFCDNLPGQRSRQQGRLPQLRFAPDVGPGDEDSWLTSWTRSKLLVPKKYTVRDFHFAMPNKTLEFGESSVIQDSPTFGEVYDYPGEYTQLFTEQNRFLEVEQEGENVARRRAEEEETPHEVFTGASYFPELQVGSAFQLTGHQTLSGTYVPTSIQHTITQNPSHFNGAAIEFPYSNLLTCVSADLSFRPMRVSLRPVVQGPQTAIVVDSQGRDGSQPDSQEIHVDSFGRIRVRFHWDRENKFSCFLRVAQIWAGRNWGAQFIPRVGQEVLVDFLEGDPDQPIVIGSLYNAVNMPPYNLPDHKTQSGIKTRSSQQGSPANFNEIRFEDLKGKEEVVIHAERNFINTVEATTMESVGGDRLLNVGHNQVEEVVGIKAGMVLASRAAQVNGNECTLVAGDRNEAALGNFAIYSNQNLELSGETQTLILSSSRISLVVGDSFIDIQPDAISISSAQVNINSGGSRAETVGLKRPQDYGGDFAEFDTWDQVLPPELQNPQQPTPDDTPPDQPEPAPSPNPLPPPPPPPQ